MSILCSCIMETQVIPVLIVEVLNWSGGRQMARVGIGDGIRGWSCLAAGAFSLWLLQGAGAGAGTALGAALGSQAQVPGALAPHNRLCQPADDQNEPLCVTKTAGETKTLQHPSPFLVLENGGITLFQPGCATWVISSMHSLGCAEKIILWHTNFTGFFPNFIQSK